MSITEDINIPTAITIIAAMAVHLVIITYKISRFMGVVDTLLKMMNDRIEKLEDWQNAIRDKMPEQLKSLEKDVLNIKDRLDDIKVEMIRRRQEHRHDEPH